MIDYWIKLHTTAMAPSDSSASPQENGVPPHDSDYDGAWKEALRRRLPAFLEKYFPAIYAAVDWSAPPEWRDKELSLVAGEAGRRNREVDLLVKVRLRSGGARWILLHVEIQSAYEEGFERRIFRYYCGLSWLCPEPVVTLAVLADLRRGWEPREAVFRLADFESRLRFPVSKLIERLEADWREDRSLPVQLARAQIEALRTAGDPEGRFRAKWRLVRNLYDLGYNADEVREAFLLIDWMIHLRRDLEEEFAKRLSTFEETLEMPYVTSVERIWKEQGEAVGAANLLLRLLSKLCGALPQEAQDRVRNLPPARLEALGDAVLGFRSLEDLEAWLASGEEAREG
jgi:hypothetical protein